MQDGRADPVRIPVGPDVRAVGQRVDARLWTLRLHRQSGRYFAVLILPVRGEFGLTVLICNDQRADVGLCRSESYPGAMLDEPALTRSSTPFLGYRRKCDDLQLTFSVPLSACRWIVDRMKSPEGKRVHPRDCSKVEALPRWN